MNESGTEHRDYIYVAMVKPQPVGRRFTQWPLHITLLPWFQAPSIAAVEQLAQAAARDFTPFTVTVGKREYFGSSRQLAVKLIKTSEQIMELHNRLLNGVMSKGWNMPGRYTGEHYRPHVTRKAGKDAEGSMQIDAIYVAEKQPQGYREIVAKVPL